MQSNDPPVPADPVSPAANNSAEEDDEISLLDLALTLAENLRLLVLGPLAAGLAALGITFAITPTFTAKTVFLPPQQQQSAASAMLAQLGALGGVAGAAAGLKNPSDQYVAFIKSRTVADALVKQFELMPRYEAKLAQDARKELENNTRVSSGKDGLIAIEVDDPDPAFAAQLANAYVDELRNLMKTLAVTEAQQRRLFFEKQLQHTRDELTRAEQALQASGVDAGAIKGSPQAAVEAVARLQAQISAQEVKLGAMRGYLNEAAPDFKQAQTELASLRAQLAKAGRPSAPTAKDADYVARYRDFKYHETLFELLSRQYEVARVDEAREGAVIQVLDAATPPERKSKPKKAQIAVLTTLAAFFVLVLFVFVRQAVRNAGQDREAAQKLGALQRALRRALGR